MAASPQVKQARKTLAWLAVIILTLLGINTAGVLWADGSWAPKLALDLEGGTQIILTAQQVEGQPITSDSLNQAVEIIRNRVDASGVAEAEITTQGSNNIVVALPGTPDAATMARIEASAQLEFRPVLLMDLASNVQQAPDDAAVDGTDDGAVDGTEAGGEDEAPATDAAEAEDEAAAEDPDAATEPTDNSDLAWVTEDLYNAFTAFECTPENLAEAAQGPADVPLITCDDQGAFKYVLGVVEVKGSSIKNATSGMSVNQQGAATGQWGVQIEFDEDGTAEFYEVTKRLYAIQQQDARQGIDSPRDQFAVVLDGAVITAPTTNAPIPNGRPEITGNFTQDSAKILAEQLRFGALPLSFEIAGNETISATLGTEQLVSGLIAGAIGMLLVIIYSVFQYRTLGTVTIASLLVAAVITYLLVTILSWRQGYRLSLAGVAGLIVAIGITADSFIVYFERIRDELRDGKNLLSAVEGGWKRAIRTILASDAVNFLAAAVLFLLAVGNVRGFAFTLGLTTLVDVLVVSMFTHPVMRLLAETKFFGNGHPASGLDPRALGAVYRGRAQFREPVALGRSKAARVSGEAQRRQTIAERKAAALAESGAKGEDA